MTAFMVPIAVGGGASGGGPGSGGGAGAAGSAGTGAGGGGSAAAVAAQATAAPTASRPATAIVPASCFGTVTSEHLGETVVADDVICVRAGAGQRRVRAQRRRADAVVNLDVDVPEGHPGVRALERLLVHRHVDHLTGPGLHLDLALDRENN